MTPPPSRPTPLVEVRPQWRALRHAVEGLGEFAPMVQILDAPVPQMVDYVAEALRLLDRPIAEQVIEVPTVFCSPCPSRSVVPVPQSAEQLVEVPTVLTPTRIALRIAEQIVDIPVPRGRGQGSLPGESTTATSSSLERPPARTVEQIVDISSPVDDLRRGSASSAGAADGFFRTFPHGKKCGVPGRWVSAELGGHVSSSTLSAHQMARAGRARRLCWFRRVGADAYP